MRLAIGLFCLVACEGPAGIDGMAGLQGPPGEKGAKGDKGDRGDKGDPGDPAPQFPATPFAGSILMTPAQQQTVNGWLGTPFRTWKLCYRRSTHGASHAMYLANCANIGPTITVVTNVNGRVYGGYNPQTILADNAYHASERAFVFSLTAGKRYPILGDSQHYAVFAGTTTAPAFGGGHDLYVNNAQSTGYCNLGHSYACNQFSSGTFSAVCSQELCGSNPSETFAISDFEVFYESNDS